MTPELVKAYMDTNYRVFSDPELVLKVGQTQPALLALFERFGVASAVFLTAWNPMSVELPLSANQQANLELRQVVSGLGLQVIDGFGAWPNDPDRGEESFLILGASRDIGHELAKQFEQAAFLLIGNSAEVELILMAEGAER